MIGKRRSIMHDAPNHWLGWDKILYYYDLAKEKDNDKDTNRHALYYVSIFETGSREGEVILLKPDQISWDDESILVERMEVLKRRRRFTRNVYIKIEDNPLAQPFIDFVESCETEYLLPAYRKRSREVIPREHTNEWSIYSRICSINPDIWPHWLRDQRSWHLSEKVELGGRGLDPYELKAWFEWASMDMPAHYAGRRREKDLMKALGITKRPMTVLK